MFLKLVSFGSKICIESIKIGFKANHHLQSLSTGCLLDESFSKSLAGFQKVKVLKYQGYKCSSFPKPSAHAYEIYLKL